MKSIRYGLRAGHEQLTLHSPYWQQSSLIYHEIGYRSHLHIVGVAMHACTTKLIKANEPDEHYPLTCAPAKWRLGAWEFEYLPFLPLPGSEAKSSNLMMVRSP